MDLQYWAGTDVGRRRSGNEDNFLIDKGLNLFAVADGMGGHAAGEIASAMVVHQLRDVLREQQDLVDRYDASDAGAAIELCTLLEHAIVCACERIHTKALREPEKRGMGTTVATLLLAHGRGFIAYVGDSRIYLLRGGIVYQLTEDHSLVNELVRKGKIRADEFEDSQYANFRHAMTRAVGVNERVDVDTLDFDVVPGDAFLLCTDGLYEYIDDHDIATALALPEIEQVPAHLIDLANTRGGKDNITALVVRSAAAAESGDRAAEANLTLDTLKRLPLFRQLSYQQLVRVMNLMRLQTVEAGQVLFQEGDPGEELFVIVRGTVRIGKGGAPITTLGAGSHFGEMSLLDSQGRSTTATAVEPGRIMSLHRHEFFEIMRKDPPLALKLLWSFLGVLAHRLRRTTAELSEARLAAQLPDLTEDLFES